MKKFASIVCAALLMVVLTYNVSADCTPIDQPGADYTGATGKCSLGPRGSTTSDCKDADGNPVVTFSSPVGVRQVGIDWATWSSPPDAEESSPVLGFFGGTNLTLTYADLASTAGTEIENNTFEPAMPVTVSFKDSDGNEVASVTRDVLGRSGARLFAVACDDAVIASADITADPGAQGFGFAQVRSDAIAFGIGPNPTGDVQPQVRENTTSNIQ
ncbi:MAG: hypothetical protein HYR55_11450 [Acidobacteria bacterium]|nr:hypothetical protein [Acidobacteriota bacterium]MBI3654793.1 hypothetical protein [Acidobacteriota bacterium]